MEKGNKKVAVSGATGFIGTNLRKYLEARGYGVVALSRGLFADGREEDLWHTVSSCSTIINLAGSPIDRRWSDRYKKELSGSRVGVTHKLVEAVNRSPETKLFISASAVGYYPSVGCYDEENAVKGNGFLSDLCAGWEAEARQVASGVRLVITRFGVVLAPRGGAFEWMARPSRMGIAAVVGDGRQLFPWIDIEDLVRGMEYLMENPELTGVFNFVAPGRITMGGFMREVARHYRSLAVIPVPAFVLRIVLGEASEFLTEGQCVLPSRLLDAGFCFSSPRTEQFLARL